MSLAVNKDTQLKRARLYPDVIHLPLDEANLCANCDTIHTGDRCPTCASTNHILLSSVIGRMPQTFRRKNNCTSPGSIETACPANVSYVPRSNAAVFVSQLLQMISWVK